MEAMRVESRDQRVAQVLESLAGRGVMSAETLDSRRVWVSSDQERLALGSVLFWRGPQVIPRILGFLNAHPEFRVFWLEQSSQAFPPGMRQWDRNAFGRILFCDAGGDLEQVQWAALQGLRSSLFQALVLRLDESLARRPAELQARLRRLRIEAERAQALVWVVVPA
jgi:hypothetical protein